MTPRPKTSPWTRLGDTDYPTGLWTDGRGEILVIQMRNGLRRSRDLGVTWEKPRKVGRGFLGSVARGPDGRLFVGSSDTGSLLVSGDDGASWTLVKLPRAGRIVALHATQGQVFAVGRDRLFRCAAGSDDWAEQPLFADKLKRTLRLRCLTSAPDGTLWLGGSSTLAGAGEGLLLRSHDAVSWAPVKLPPAIESASALSSSGKALYLEDTGRVHRSSDDGATWTDVTPPMVSQNGVKALLALGDTVMVVEDYYTVLRSEDRGATWRVDYEDKDVGNDQDALVPSSTGHLLLLNALGVFAREEPLARAVPPAAVAAPVATASPPATRTPWEDRLDQALALWKATRDPAMASLVDNVSGRVTSGSRALDGLTGNKLQQAWVRLAGEGHPGDVPALLGTLSTGTLAEVAERVAALAPHAEDPRVAHDLAQWLATYPYGSTGSKPLWTAAFRLLATCADERAVPLLQAALAGGVPVSGETMRTWLEAAIPKALDKIEAAAKRGSKPLTAAQQKQVAALEKALAAS